MISGIKHKGIMAAICVLAAIALFAGLGGSTRDNLLALTVGTEHGNAHHDILLVKRTSSWHTSGSKSTSETLPSSELAYDQRRDRDVDGDARDDNVPNRACLSPLF